MSTTTAQEIAPRRTLWSRLSVVVTLLVFCFSTVAGMGWLVLREIDDLSTANSDNLQWSLAQVDVEFLQLEVALLEAERDPSLLPVVRRRFDIFYSRMSTLERGEVFRDMRENPDYDAPRANVRDFLDATVPLIDGPPEDLRAALPDLAREVGALTDDVRELSLAGLTSFAELSDARRDEVTTTLLVMAAVLALLLAGLSLLALSFRRLYRLSELRARDLRQTGARMQTIVETSVDAIVVSDKTGRIVDVNGAAVCTFGYPKSELIGRSALETLFPADIQPILRDDAMAAVAEGRRPRADRRVFESVAVTRDGRRFPAEMSIDRAEDESEVVYVAFVRDISRRKAAEEGLTEARDKALAGEKAKAEFLAVMSHEMRTPLNGLLGTMQLMRDHDLTERQTELLDRMVSSGRLLLGLVNDVLDLSKFEAGKLTAERRPFEIQRLLDGVIETTASLAASNGNALSWQWVGPPGRAVLGDSRLLRQVLLNLVGNAVKFTRGGTIDIEVEQIGDGDNSIEFRVIDSGVGIADGNLDRIFNDFETLDSSYSRQTGGTGLGLGIARRLVGLMGGEIGVESELGEGSLFWIRIPLDPVEDRPTPIPARDATAGEPSETPPGLSVLLVEDNEINRFVAREMLEAEGHVVTEAVNGRAGVEWAEARHFDAILMDISMPVMDGQDAARAIRAGAGPSATTPIIAVTAHALPDEIAKFRAAGMDGCISKPVDRALLASTLRDLARGGHGIEPAPSPDSVPLLDEAQFDSLRATIGPAHMAELIDRFVDELDAAIAALAAERPGKPDLGPRAHRCAGSCATLGLAAMRSALGRIETAARTGAVSADDLIALGPLWRRSRAALVDRAGRASAEHGEGGGESD
ncbi:Aerobic respiration control sensor protein ArcB [Roseivivax jejudonensis]|uniref:histidine kinase n=1 Tax=Roseivivax jejudonensis TaxID=1529041 RepID=A0A1X6Y4L1_9RHOB|nr:ATP-binding protein [Roseivivax jejudonensis]SLN10171.1 Aerobic respiration control sensor protein ArcB [Roseivivax jejudonensis]